MHLSQKPIFIYPFQQFVEESRSPKLPKPKILNRKQGQFHVSELSSHHFSLPRLATLREETQGRVVKFINSEQSLHSCTTINELPLFKQSKNYMKVPERKPRGNAQKLDKLVRQQDKPHLNGEHSNRQATQSVDLYRIHAQQFSNNILKDEVLGPLMKIISDPEFFSTLFHGFYEFGRTKQLLFNEEKLRRFLADLSITNSHFDRMKNLMLAELINMQLPPEYILPCIWRMETFRYSFTHSRTPLDHMGEQAGLLRISERAYALVTQDFILSEYFKSSNDLAAQVVKFSRLLSKLIRFQETPTNIMEFLRVKHRKFDLTHVHFAMFKLKVATAFRESGLPLKLLWHLISLIDLYKHDVLNYESVGDLITESYGDCKAFSEELHSQCVDRGPDLVMSTDRFKKLVDFTMAYLVSPWRLGIEYRSLWHHFKVKLKPSQMALVQQQLFKLVGRLNPHPIVLNDFTEQWEELHQYFRGQLRPFEVLGGWDEVSRFGVALYEESKEDTYLMSTYRENGIDPYQVMYNELLFMCSGKKFYKKSDLRCIHERFFITDKVFDMYVKNVQTGLDKCGLGNHTKYMVDLVEGYRSVIVLQ